MKRAEEFALNQAVKAGLKEKGIENVEAVIIGYKLGHKYLDHGITNALPTILEKIAEATDLNYRAVSRMVYKVIPTTVTKGKAGKKEVKKPSEFGNRAVSQPMNDPEYFKKFLVKK